MMVTILNQSNLFHAVIFATNLIGNHQTVPHLMLKVSRSGHEYFGNGIYVFTVFSELIAVFAEQYCIIACGKIMKIKQIYF